MILFLLFVLGTCDQIVGGGSPNSAQLFEEWSFAYEVLLQKQNIGVDYLSVENSAEAVDQLNTRCRKIYNYDYAGLDMPLSLFKPGPDTLDSVPLFGEAIAFVYNLNTTSTDPINLQLSELLDIFLGKRITWEQIASVRQPEAYGKRINLVLRDDQNGLTRALTQYFHNVSSEWTWGVFSTWRNDTNGSAQSRWQESYTAMVGNQTVPTFVTGPYGTIAQVLYNPWSFGYSALNFAKQGNLQFANVETLLSARVNDANESNRLPVYRKYLSPEDPVAVPARLKYFDLNDTTGTSIVAIPDNVTYPFVQVTYIAYHNDSSVDCELRRSLFLFFNWILTNPTAQDRASSLDYIPLPEDLGTLATKKLSAVKCGNVGVLDMRIYDDTRTITRQIVSSLSAVMLSLTVAVLLTLGYKRNNRITKAAGLAFAICFLVGCILNYVSLFVWAMTPNSDTVCSTRVGLLFVGYALILGAMFAKSWEISKIFYRAEKGDISPFQELPWWKFCRVFFFIVGIEMLIILVWMASDSPSAKLADYDPILRIFRYQCEMNAGPVWLSLQVIYYVVLMIWGSYLAYITRDIWAKYNYPNESRSILLSIFNMGFVAIALLPMVYVLDITDDVFFFLVSVTILIPTSFALLSVYVPKVLEFLGSANSSKHSKGSAQKKTASGLPNSKTAKSWVEMEPIKGGRGHDEQEVDLVQAVSGTGPGSGGGILRKSDSNLKGSNRTESRLGVEMVPMSLNRVAEEDEDAVSVVEIDKGDNNRPRGHSTQQQQQQKGSKSKSKRAQLGSGTGSTGSTGAAPTTPRNKIEDETLAQSGWRILAPTRSPIVTPVDEEKTPFFTSIFDSPEAAAQSDLMTGGVEDVASMVRTPAKEQHKHSD